MSTTAKKTPPRRAKPGVSREREFRLIDSATGIPGLSASEERFAAALAKGQSQSAAFREAFPRSASWKVATIHARASELAGNETVRDRVRALIRVATEANQIDVNEVFRQYMLRLTADPRELVEYRIGACRYCHGHGFRYHYTAGEMEKARESHDLRREQNLADGRGDIGPFDEKGGTGYLRVAAPNPECPECCGEGVGRLLVKDSQQYSEAALTIYAGVKESKDGIEVKIGDRDAALEKIARHLGFFAEDNKQQVTHKVDTSELDALYERKMAEAQEAGKHARGRRGRLGLETTGLPTTSRKG